MSNSTVVQVSAGQFQGISKATLMVILLSLRQGKAEMVKVATRFGEAINNQVQAQMHRLEGTNNKAELVLNDQLMADAVLVYNAVAACVAEDRELGPVERNEVLGTARNLFSFALAQLN